MKILGRCLVTLLLTTAVSAPSEIAQPGTAEKTLWNLTQNTAVGEAVAEPVSPTLVASEEARQSGKTAHREELLIKALKQGSFSDIVRLELAEILGAREPDRAFDLIFPLLGRAPTPQMREGALTLLKMICANGLDSLRLQRLRNQNAHFSHSLRREIDILIARPEDAGDRKKLDRAISTNSRDLPALEAAEKLASLESLTARELWSIAQVYYRHALYARAIPLLEALIAKPEKGIPLSELSYIRGRCSFRNTDYSDARFWYQKALSDTPKAETRAGFEVHIARCFELEGDLHKAIIFAQRAVRSRATDERRLFLARLRLRTHRPDLAALGVSRVRSRTKRSRGALLIALSFQADGGNEETLQQLHRISSSVWKGPARVLMAMIYHLENRNREALEKLREASESLDDFWKWRARILMSKLSQQLTDKWREDIRSRSTRPGRTGLRALRQWAALEFDDAGLEDLRNLVKGKRQLSGDSATIQARGLALKLSRAGLPRLALRWDPDSFPKATPEESLWSASRSRDFPWLAILHGDTAWRQLGADLAPETYDPQVLGALYPLTKAENLQGAIAGHTRLSASLLAAVAREESRWNPQALSAVGARGLLQLMPSTAAEAARREKIAAPSPSDLFRSNLNLRLGASELEELLRKFHGFQPAAIAAYNSGADQAELWKAQCGSECTVESYILNIGFNATREYTADVLLAERRYRTISQNEALHAADERAVATDRLLH